MNDDCYCPACREEKPEAEFGFYHGVRAKYCKACRAAHSYAMCEYLAKCRMNWKKPKLERSILGK